MYNDKAMDTRKESLQNWQGWDFNPPNRNGRKRKEHLHAEFWTNDKGRPTTNVCRQNRELALQFMREQGEIKGRPMAQEKVRQYRAEYPDGTKTHCKEVTGLSYPTIRKWWD
jgi:hypothetical protein